MLLPRQYFALADLPILSGLRVGFGGMHPPAFGASSQHQGYQEKKDLHVWASHIITLPLSIKANETEASIPETTNRLCLAVNARTLEPQPHRTQHG